jgi:hypothetical protein
MCDDLLKNYPGFRGFLIGVFDRAVKAEKTSGRELSKFISMT